MLAEIAHSKLLGDGDCSGLSSDPSRHQGGVVRFLLFTFVLCQVPVPDDIDISQSVQPKPILQVALESGILESEVLRYRKGKNQVIHGTL